MSCSEYGSGLIELARGGALPVGERQTLLVHVHGCAECARILDEQRALHASLERLSAEEFPIDPGIEAHVLAQFDRAPVRRAKRFAVRWLLAAGVAAAVSLGALWTLRWAPQKPATVTALREDTPFLTIPYTIPVAPEERTEIVRMQIPVTALLAAGFHVRVSDPSAAVDADVVVSQDGRARAIRPLTISISN